MLLLQLPLLAVEFSLEPECEDEEGVRPVDMIDNLKEHREQAEERKRSVICSDMEGPRAGDRRYEGDSEGGGFNGCRYH
jgi:hypothetical protein